MGQKRRLIIIPVAHTPADMGSLKEQVSYGEGYEEAVTRHWVQVFNYVKSLPVDFSRLKVYQDSLADTDPGIVEKIVAETQTANYEILRYLKEKGASIIGTENPRLLTEEHQSLEAIFNSSDEASKEMARLEYLKKSFWLLEERDSCITQKIEETLGPGETGLLFIGASHNVEEFLAEDVEVSKPGISETSLPRALGEFWGMGKERK